MKEGRPTKFKDEYCHQAEKICLLGATDKELANFFEVAVSTINLWKKEFPEFSASVKKGKTLADANVAQRLYERAMGFEHPEVKHFVVRVKDTEEVQEREVIKQYPPDTVAAIFWLKNRNKANWRDKQSIEFENMSEQQLDEIISSLIKKST